MCLSDKDIENIFEMEKKQKVIKAEMNIAILQYFKVCDLSNGETSINDLPDMLKTGWKPIELSKIILFKNIKLDYVYLWFEYKYLVGSIELIDNYSIEDLFNHWIENDYITLIWKQFNIPEYSITVLEEV